MEENMISIPEILVVLMFIGLHLMSLVSAQRFAHMDGKDTKAKLLEMKNSSEMAKFIGKDELKGINFSIPNMIFGMIGTPVALLYGYSIGIVIVILLASIGAVMVVTRRYNDIYLRYHTLIKAR